MPVPPACRGYVLIQSPTLLDASLNNLLTHTHRGRNSHPNKNNTGREEEEEQEGRSALVSSVCFILGYKITNGACHKETCR